MKTWLNSLITYLAGLLMGITLSCTVLPEPPHETTPSFDGGAQNSGFLGFDAAGRGILTANARARYNALIATYGARYAPPLTLDAGLTPTATNTFLIEPQFLVDFREMNRWRKANPNPTTQ